MSDTSPLLMCSRCQKKVTLRKKRWRILVKCETCNHTFIHYSFEKIIEEDNLPRFVQENY
jgi:hypothetical protein